MGEPVIPTEAYNQADTARAIEVWSRLCADGYKAHCDETGKQPWKFGPGPMTHIDPADYDKCKTEEDFAALFGTAKAIALLKGE